MKLFKEDALSFSQDQKADIILQSVKSTCCKRAFMQGVLAARGRVDNSKIFISVDSTETAEFIKGIILEVYSKSADDVTSSLGGRRKILSFDAKSAIKYISDITQSDLFYSEKCAM